MLLNCGTPRTVFARSVRAVTGAALAAGLLLGTVGASPAPAPLYSPVAPGKATDAVKAYVGALARRDYAAAFALLDDPERQYFRNVADYSSIYTADGLIINNFTIVGQRGSGGGRLFFVHEKITVNDLSTGKPHPLDLVVAYGAINQVAGWRIHDPSHPWRAFAPDATATQNGVRLRVIKMAFYTRRIEVVLAISNVGDSFVTTLPYGKSVLRDASGTVYRLLDTKDWRLTNRQLFLGLRLAPNAQYVGTIAFESPQLDDSARTWSMTLAPVLQDGGDAPFSVVVNGIAAPPASTQSLPP